MRGVFVPRVLTFFLKAFKSKTIAVIAKILENKSYRHWNSGNNMIAECLPEIYEPRATRAPSPKN